MRPVICVTILLAYLAVGASSARTRRAPPPDPPKAKCISPEMVDGVDEKWVDDFSRAPGLYNTLSYQFSDWRSTSTFPPAPPVDKAAKHKRCWKVFMKTPQGPFEEFRSTCTYYNDVARQTCRMETVGTSLAGLFRHYGSYQIVLTDQQSYIVVYACLMGAKNFFMTLSRTAHLSDSTRAKIEDYLFNKLKFDKSFAITTNTTHKADIAIQKLEMVDCVGGDGGSGQGGGGGYPWPNWPSTSFWSRPFQSGMAGMKWA